MATWAILQRGQGIALQLDGIISRNSTADSTVGSKSTDIEFFSSTGKGAMQGKGYVFHQPGSLSG